MALSQRCAVACNHLDDHVESGFVRILHEMTAAGWSSDAVGPESPTLPGMEDEGLPLRQALRGIGRLISRIEEGAP